MNSNESASDKKSGRSVRVALVTNIPAPYRLPVFEGLGTDERLVFKAFFCNGREPDRQWSLRKSHFEQQYLRERYVSFRGRYIHFNPDVWGALRAFCPDVVITTGFNPTHLIAYAFSRTHGAQHIAMTDGTFESENSLTSLHRWIRNKVYKRTRAFIGASDGSLDLYRSYGIDERLLFKSHLCADNESFASISPVRDRYDLIFSGRFVDIKNPLFALAVAQGASRRLGRRVSIVFLGSGELEEKIRLCAAQMSSEVKVIFPGFAKQEELPLHYAAAKVLLFPTSWDPWGVVANEACAAGLPVLVTPVAGSAGELIRNGENGFVLPLDLNRWIDATVRLLSDDVIYARFSARGRQLVTEYNYANAARGLTDAVFASKEIGTHA